MSVNPVVPYLLTGLAGYSVDPGISRGARKLPGHRGLSKIVVVVVVVIIIINLYVSIFLIYHFYFTFT